MDDAMVSIHLFPVTLFPHDDQIAASYYILQSFRRASLLTCCIGWNWDIGPEIDPNHSH